MCREPCVLGSILGRAQHISGSLKAMVYEDDGSLMDELPPLEELRRKNATAASHLSPRSLGEKGQYRRHINASITPSMGRERESRGCASTSTLGPKTSRTHKVQIRRSPVCTF